MAAQFDSPPMLLKRSLLLLDNSYRFHNGINSTIILLRVRSRQAKVNANVKVKMFLLSCLALLGVNTTNEMQVNHFSQSKHDFTFAFAFARCEHRFSAGINVKNNKL